jgi:hypothetical protein
MIALNQTLTACLPLLPESYRAANAALLRPDLLTRLANRLAFLALHGVPVERPEPHFSEEVTPPLGPVFEPFRPVLDVADPGRWAGALAEVGADGLLLLLGQRRTPASRTDASAAPPTTEHLLAAADAPCGPRAELSAAGRAWAKHAPRSGAQFWGTVSGSDAEKNAAARRLVDTILAGATWWNVFGHFVHDTVFEARVPSGHGARWGDRGTVFIGFLEPFLNEEKR